MENIDHLECSVLQPAEVWMVRILNPAREHSIPIRLPVSVSNDDADGDLVQSYDPRTEKPMTPIQQDDLTVTPDRHAYFVDPDGKAPMYSIDPFRSANSRCER